MSTSIHTVKRAHSLCSGCWGCILVWFRMSSMPPRIRTYSSVEESFPTWSWALRFKYTRLPRIWSTASRVPKLQASSFCWIIGVPWISPHSPTVGVLEGSGTRVSVTLRGILICGIARIARKKSNTSDRSMKSFRELEKKSNWNRIRMAHWLDLQQRRDKFQWLRWTCRASFLLRTLRIVDSEWFDCIAVYLLKEEVTAIWKWTHHNRRTNGRCGESTTGDPDREDLPTGEMGFRRDLLARRRGGGAEQAIQVKRSSSTRSWAYL